MSGVLTLAASVAAAVGVVAAVRYIDRQRKDLSERLRSRQKGDDASVIDYEQDPETGVYRPRD